METTNSGSRTKRIKTQNHILFYGSNGFVVTSEKERRKENGEVNFESNKEYAPIVLHTTTRVAVWNNVVEALGIEHGVSMWAQILKFGLGSHVRSLPTKCVTEILT